ncbi:hypothetical protein DCCM_4077 [Desulfocucumis palustris]|uniref:Uncharacterized protein n=1 Tax=Desulfocucumis palustris TaxID=1898651 RepID=A0A2L2XF35_9FIRM|nr:hypothetical protein DCCM_4077 [Desulfocucumis palustris]
MQRICMENTSKYNICLMRHQCIFAPGLLNSCLLRGVDYC